MPQGIHQSSLTRPQCHDQMTCPPQTSPVESWKLGSHEGRPKCQEKVTDAPIDVKWWGGVHNALTYLNVDIVGPRAGVNSTTRLLKVPVRQAPLKVSQRPAQVRHLNGCFGVLAAYVLSTRVGAVHRLISRVRGENAKDNWFAGFSLHG
jgi:hypothetical protein